MNALACTLGEDKSGDWQDEMKGSYSDSSLVISQNCTNESGSSTPWGPEAGHLGQIAIVLIYRHRISSSSPDAILEGKADQRAQCDKARYAERWRSKCSTRPWMQEQTGLGCAYRESSSESEGAGKKDGGGIYEAYGTGITWYAF